MADQPTEGPQIMIELTGPNSVNIVGPIDQKHLCFGMLEMAKAAIEEHHREKKQAAAGRERIGGVVPPTDTEIETMLREQRSKAQ